VSLNHDRSLSNGNQGSEGNFRVPSCNLIGELAKQYQATSVKAHFTYRRLIMDGPLLLTRVVRKVTIAFELINGQGDSTTNQVECLSPEQTPRSLLGILCNDLLVLCRDPSDGKDPLSHVDLWAVLRMQTLPQPASIVHGNGGPSLIFFAPS
jgi:hypothetical protein